MKRSLRSEPQVVWRREERTLTLEGEPVLEYALSWPEVEGAGLGGKWITAYYRRLAREWRLRWQREVYWRACLELAQRRAAARPFTPWTGKLEGEVALLEGGLLSLRLEGEEVRGDGKTCRVCWGDAWKVRSGAPCSARELFGGKRGWKKEVFRQVREQGEQRRAAGDLFLDRDWAERAPRLLSLEEACLTSEGARLFLPQGAASPAAEGTPAFLVRCQRVPPPEGSRGPAENSNRD